MDFSLRIEPFTRELCARNLQISKFNLVVRVVGKERPSLFQSNQRNANKNQELKMSVFILEGFIIYLLDIQCGINGILLRIPNRHAHNVLTLIHSHPCTHTHTLNHTSTNHSINIC